jgi:hypothetical protein
MGSQEQMVRINARRVVAAMENPKGLWNFALMESVKRSMGMLPGAYHPVSFAVFFFATKIDPTTRRRDPIISWPL